MPLNWKFLPSIASLRAIEALDRLGSASAVAEELNQTQSAVSRQLGALEEQLGQSLFVRKSRRLHLTPAARAYVGEVRRALEQIAQASMRLSFDPTGGTVHLAILPTFGMRWLVPRLPDFARLHPEVTINLSTRIDKVNFDAEPYDAAIEFGSGMRPGTMALKLRPEQVIAVCAPGLLAERTLASVDEARHLPLMHIASRPDAWTAWFEARGVRDARITGMVYDQFSTITQAALHGLGAALLPDYLAEADLVAGRLVPVWGGAVESPGAYHLVHPVEKSGDPALRKFRDWLAGQSETEADPLPR